MEISDDNFIIFNVEKMERTGIFSANKIPKNVVCDVFFVVLNYKSTWYSLGSDYYICFELGLENKRFYSL